MQPQFILILWLLWLLVCCSQLKDEDEKKENRPKSVCEVKGEDLCASAPQPLTETRQRQCIYAKNNPEMILEWQLSVSRNPQEEASTCVNEHLKNKGVTNIENQGTLLYFKATYPQVEPLLNKKAIESMTFEPLTDLCIELPTTEACEANAFCMNRKGAKINLRERCIVLENLCQKYSLGCGTLIVYAQDPVGNYWVGDTRMPSNFITVSNSGEIQDSYNWPLCSP